MSVVWPINCPSIKGPYTSTNIYTDIFLKSSPIDKAGISLLVGNTSRTTLLKSTKEKYNIITGLIDNPSLNLTGLTIPLSSGMKSILSLQVDSFAQAALLPDDYLTINLDLFNQFALPSSIIVSMLGYGNKNNISNINDINDPIPINNLDPDIIGVWPHLADICPMGSIIDGLTLTIKNYRGLTDLTSVAQQISEWRWLHPNRPRCNNPKSPLLKSQINAANLANITIYPQGSNKWEILRYDFFASDMVNNTLILNDNDFPMSNDIFDFSYNYLAAPGCLLITVKRSFIYDDGTGSVVKGLNTSRITVDPSSINFPTVFRVGLEWLEDFILAMEICKPLDGNNAPINISPLILGANLIRSLRFLYKAYTNCKRLYIWRICHDIMRYRITINNSIISPISNKIPGVYICLLEGITDYSGVVVNAPTIDQPKWENMYIKTNSEDNLVVLTTVELSAYVSASLVNEGVPPDKYGNIRVFTDLSGFPQQSFNMSYIDFTNPEVNTISLESCQSNSNCFVPFLPTTIIKGVTEDPPKGTSLGSIVLYIILIIIIIMVIIILLYLYFRKPPSVEYLYREIEYTPKELPENKDIISSNKEGRLVGKEFVPRRLSSI